MDLEQFTSDASGHLVRTVGNQKAFTPNPLPPSIDIRPALPRLMEAERAIGELKGACRRLINPNILIQPLQRQEALTSSAMEGTFTSSDQLVLFEMDERRVSDSATREVHNYLRALDHARRLLVDLPICHRVIREAHRYLLSNLPNDRGANKRPGDYRQEQNWIGGGSRSIATARFVPPPPKHMHAALDDLENYINRTDQSGALPLVDLALVHYQFETIHPFHDGNGRVGRMLITLMSLTTGLLDEPVLYMSPAFERTKDRYIDLMFNVSTKGEWLPWLDYFLEIVVQSCRKSISTVDALINLQEDYRQRAAAVTRSANALSLVDRLFERPALTISDAEAYLGLTYAGADRIVKSLVRAGILSDHVKSYPKVYFATEVINVAFDSDAQT